ncbi:MAG: YopX family protein [Candidatus Omnitrophota bacterium]
MRQIKIKYWNKKLKEMSEPMGIALVWETLCELWGIFEWHDVVKLQWTGLTDQGGTEIFEGDRLLVDKTEYIVYFDLGCFLCRMAEYPENRVELMQIYKISEVIGDIFNNQELLK